MITQETVLILGAGASMPYHFPSGKGLIEKIIDNRDYDSLINSYLLPAGISVGNFRLSLEKSKLNSIDVFLEKNPSLIKAGKIAIASVLLPLERECNFNKDNIRDDYDWYEYLYNLLFESPTFEDFGKNLSVITFNYDRSFAHFLHTSLVHSYCTQKKPEECEAILKKIPIIHIYGKLGNLPWETNDESPKIPYGGNFANLDEAEKHRCIDWAARFINILPEGHNANDEQEKEIDGLIIHANKIFFLGFGFHPENLRKINLDSLDFGDVKATIHDLPNDRRKELLNFTTIKGKYIFAAPHSSYQEHDGAGVLFNKTVGKFVHEVGLT